MFPDYMSLQTVLFVSFISVDLLILNSSGTKYKVENFHLLSWKILIQNLLHRYLMKTKLRNTLDNLIAEAIKEARLGSRHKKVY